MYSFGAYTYGLAAGQAPAPGSVHWTMADGYLPAMTTSFTRNNVAISITDFANEQSIGGNPVELIYTRVSVTNHGPPAVTSQPASPGRTSSRSTRSPIASHRGRPCITTSSPQPTPSPRRHAATVSAITPSRGNPGALPYDTAYRHMTDTGTSSSRPPRDCRCPTSPGQHQQPAHPGHRDRQRLQGRVRLHQDRSGRRGAVLRRQQLRLPAQPRPARHPGQPVRAG